MTRQHCFIFFSVILLFFKQQAMYKFTGHLFKKHKNCTSFTEKLVKVLDEKGHTQAPDLIQLISQEPLDKVLLEKLRVYSKSFHTDVVVLVSKMVWLNQKRSIDLLKDNYVRVKCLPDEDSKYLVVQDDMGNIADITTSDDVRTFADQVALLTYGDYRVFVTNKNSPGCSVVREKASSNFFDHFILKNFLNDSQKQFKAMQRKSKNELKK